MTNYRFYRNRKEVNGKVEFYVTDWSNKTCMGRFEPGWKFDTHWYLQFSQVRDRITVQICDIFQISRSEDNKVTKYRRSAEVVTFLWTKFTEIFLKWFYRINFIPLNFPSIRFFFFNNSIGGVSETLPLKLGENIWISNNMWLIFSTCGLNK